MLQPIDRKTAEIAVEQPQMGEHPVGQAGGIGHELRPDHRPVLLGALVHAAEGCSRLRFVHWMSPRLMDCREAALLAMRKYPAYIRGDGDRQRGTGTTTAAGEARATVRH